MIRQTPEKEKCHGEIWMAGANATEDQVQERMETFGNKVYLEWDVSLKWRQSSKVFKSDNKKMVLKATIS